MEQYLAMRIQSGALDYNAVISRYPDKKDAIDKLLDAQ